jgi:Retroviral aspartyl protease
MMNVGWDDSGRNTVLDKDCLKCLEEQELGEAETDLSSLDDERFLLLVEVMDSESEAYADIDTHSESEVEMVYEAEVLISSMRLGIGITLPKTKITMIAQPVKLCKSSKLMKHPVRTTKETRAFISMVKVNSQEAVVLLDSGYMMDALSPELVRVTGIKVYELMDQVPIQLGTRGSQSKISCGIKTTIKYGPIDTDHYFDVVNIDRYDVILGMVFMRRHGILLDFGMHQV